MSEWSAPKKSNGGSWSSESGYGPSATVYQNEFFVDGQAIPRDTALRLLAAEANDRLGIEWKYFRRQSGDRLSHIMQCRGMVEWIGYEESREMGVSDEELLSPDELLAYLHGRYLLEAAMKAAK